jgi:hypothetical protein
VLETAFPDILKAYPMLRQFYRSDLSALDNYRAHLALSSMLHPALERHAPERIQAVKEEYAEQMAAVEKQMAALD